MSRRPRTVHEQRVARALRTMAPGGRLASESPIRRRGGTLGSYSVGAVTVAPTLPTEDSGVFRQASGTGPFYGWGSTPSTGSMILGVGVANWYITDTVGDITPPDGWRVLASGTEGPGTGDHTMTWVVACIDSFDGTEDRQWFMSDDPDAPVSAQMLTWRVAGASGMTWRAPVVNVTAYTPTLSAGNWSVTGTADWADPAGSWLLNCQMILPCGIATVSDPASPGGMTAGTPGVSSAVSPYDGLWDLTGSPQTTGIPVAGGVANWLIDPYSPPLASVVSFALGAK
jgi:hypothetical protein